MKTRLKKINGIYIKDESQNISGSIKDRFAEFAFYEALAAGELQEGQPILEATSGNTGIAFARLAQKHGHPFTAVMPEFASMERREKMEAYGANVVITPSELGVRGTIRAYNDIALANKKFWLPRQFENLQNIEAHYRFTGSELVEQLRGMGIERVDAFVAGVGTGGTILGVSKALKEAFGKIRVVAVEPAESAVLSGGRAGMHQIEGIGEGFVPPLVNIHRDEIDDVVAIRSKDAINEMNRLQRKHGLSVGISTGANMLASKELKNKYDYQVVVTVAPDSSDRYISI